MKRASYSCCNFLCVAYACCYLLEVSPVSIVELAYRLALFHCDTHIHTHTKNKRAAERCSLTSGIIIITITRRVAGLDIFICVEKREILVALQLSHDSSKLTKRYSLRVLYGSSKMIKLITSTLAFYSTLHIWFDGDFLRSLGVGHLEKRKQPFDITDYRLIV